MAGQHVKTFTKDNFASDVLQSDVPVMVDFWATWCGPCRAMAPIVDEIAEAAGDKAKVGKVNVDEENELAGEYGIRSIPSLLFFKDGKVVDQQVGRCDKQTALDKLGV